MENLRVLFVVLFSLLVVACSVSTDEDVTKLQGETMGTTWHVTIVGSEDSNFSIDRAFLKQLIETELLKINQQFSTYIKDSEVSHFNAFNSTEPFKVSKEIVQVIQAAQMISTETQGAFDLSVAPLVELWGFGGQNNSSDFEVSISKPPQSAILKLLQNTGYQHLTVKANPPRIVKNIPSLRIDLSAIAKGYAVDQLAGLVERQGFHRYLVEIGGEIKVKGHNSRGELWRIAIEKPVSNAQISQQIISLKDISVATSGDYHNYFEADGVRYSHTIDPKTGSPVTHRLASVTVLHESAMMADGFATAMMVLGEKKGLLFAKQKGLQVYMILRKDNKGSSEEAFEFISTLSAESVDALVE